MSTIVWFVPGFMGSTLGIYSAARSPTNPGPKVSSIWGTIASAPLMGHPEYLAFPTIMSPSLQILADGVVPSQLGGYSDFVAYMSSVMPTAWSFFAWPYDWRLSARGLGRALATAIESYADRGFDNRILGHSYGGLIAWAAWAALVDDGRTAAVSRITTMGGALYGTNSTPSIFRENEASIGQLAILQSAFSANPYLAVGTWALGPTDYQVGQLLNVVRTWPAVYDLYPDVNMLEDPTDSNRPLASDPTKWTAALVQPDFTLMAAEFAQLHNWLRVPKYLPPYAVANHIVGQKLPTPWHVRPAASSLPGALSPQQKIAAGMSQQQLRLLQLPSWEVTLAGDGRCTNQQQMFPGYYSLPLVSQHAAMQFDQAVMSGALDLLQRSQVPPPPANPLSAVPGPPVQHAVSGVPQFLIDAGPEIHAPPAPRPVVRVGVDP